MVGGALQYRADIDGLRAISVLLVILHHLDLTFFSGGFVGVDVFFVISGFLMTGIISRELTTDEFSFKGFYQRRIHRIAPAFFVVILATTIAACLLLLPPDLVNFAHSVQFSVVGLANVFMWKTYGGYFAAESSEAPLLHLWSLGVEEQFYLLWPLFLFLGFRIVKARWLGLLVVVLFIASAALSQWWTTASTQGGSAYYLLPPRAQELLLGGIAFFFSQRNVALPSIATQLLRLLGLALILVSSVVYTELTPFPGAAALLPCSGAALLLAMTPTRNDQTSLWLAQPWMVYVGKISYPLYLWHWPLVAFANYWLLEFTWPLRVGIFFLTWLLSDLTWRWIEKPLRTTHTQSPRQSFLRLLLIPGTVLFALALLVVARDGFYGRYDQSSEIRQYFSAVNSSTKEFRGQCHVNRRDFASPLNTDTCRLGETEKSTLDGLVIGDSFANHYTPILDELARRQGLRLADYTMNECRPVKDFNINPECLERNERIFKHIAQSSYPFVVLGGAWALTEESEYEHNRPLSDQFLHTLKLITDSGAVPVVISRTPTIPGARSCSIKQTVGRPNLECGIPRSVYDEDNAYFQGIIDTARSQFPQLQVIDVSELLCDEQRCHTRIDAMPVYSDDGHLGADGSRHMGEILWERGIRLPAANAAR